jgi:hypothetical protein
MRSIAAPRPPEAAPSTPPAPEMTNETTRDLLRALVTQVAIPNLVTRHSGALAHSPLANPSIAELAGFLLAADPTGAFDRVSRLHAGVDSLGAFCATVLEPSARRLGDLWGSDNCSEVDVTIGLSRLQSALRRTSIGKPAPKASHEAPGTVLVAPQPGELHMLGSVLDAELLWRAGWRTQCEFPATDQALLDLLSKTWFDALDLSMSLAFCHEHRLPRMGRTIRLARQASRNPELRIVVGGRVFFERPDAGREVGADAASGSTSQVEALILGTAGNRPSPMTRVACSTNAFSCSDA